MLERVLRIAFLMAAAPISPAICASPQSLPPVEVFESQAEKGISNRVAAVSENNLVLIDERAKRQRGMLADSASYIAVWDIGAHPKKLLRLVDDGVSEGNALNRSAVVVGRRFKADAWQTQADAAAWTLDASVALRLDVASGPGVGTYRRSVASDVNDDNVIVGSITFANGASPDEPSRAVVWCGLTARPLLLPLPAGEPFAASHAASINNSGVIVGWAFNARAGWLPAKWTVDRGCSRIEGPQILGKSPGAATKALRDGRIIGYADLAERGTRAAIWRDGIETLLPAHAPEGHRFYANDLSESGVVVGKMRTQSDDQFVAAVWCADGNQSDSGRLRLAGPSGWTLLGEIRAVTREGWLLGTGRNGRGTAQAFLSRASLCTTKQHQ